MLSDADTVTVATYTLPLIQKVISMGRLPKPSRYSAPIVTAVPFTAASIFFSMRLTTSPSREVSPAADRSNVALSPSATLLTLPSNAVLPTTSMFFTAVTGAAEVPHAP